MTTTAEQISEDAQNHVNRAGTGTVPPDLSGLYRVIDDQYIKSDAAQFAPAPPTPEPTEGPPVTVDASELMTTPSPGGGGGGDWGGSGGEGGGDDGCCCCFCCCE